MFLSYLNTYVDKNLFVNILLHTSSPVNTNKSNLLLFYPIGGKVRSYKDLYGKVEQA